MKKTISFLLVIVTLAFSLTACGDPLPTHDEEIAEIFCTECGKGLLATDKFCSECGYAIGGTKNVQSTTEVPTTKTSTTTKAPTTSVHKHSYSEASCTEPAQCACGATKGSALGHTCEVGVCSRCGFFWEPEIVSPSTPITSKYILWNKRLSTMQINELKCEFNAEGSLIITFSGEKTAGPNAMIAFDYKLADADGYIVGTGTWSNSEYDIGDIFKNEKVTLSHIVELGEWSDKYTLIIVDHSNP